METPVLAQRADHIGGGETERKREQAFATRIDVRDVFLGSQEESVLVLDTAATANLVCFSRLERHNRASENMGFRESPHVPRRQDSALAVGALGRYAMRLTLQRGSQGLRGSLLRFWATTFQRNCANAPWRD